MPPGKFLSIAGAVILSLSPGKVSAQSAAPETSQPFVNATIGSDSGKERRLHGHDGYIGRAGLRPNQKVAVTLDCPGSQKGDAVRVGSLDGGGIVPANETLKVGPDGTVFFKFEAGAYPGLYRVLIEVGGRQHLLEFYVLDLARPGNNPPRVRIVD
jgi:hypothetical protein